MKINKSYAFELLQKLEEHYPKYTSLKSPNGMMGKNPELTEKEQYKIDTHITYLVDESFLHEKTGKYLLTSKAINLLTDEIDMETWIKKVQKCS